MIVMSKEDFIKQSKRSFRQNHELISIVKLMEYEAEHITIYASIMRCKVDSEECFTCTAIIENDEYVIEIIRRYVWGTTNDDVGKIYDYITTRDYREYFD